VERGNLRLRCERKSHKWKNHEDESTDAQARGGTARSSDEVCDKQMERRGGVMEPNSTANQRWEELMSEAKPFEISKREVWEAYRKVKGNKGAAGVDGQTIAEYEEALKDNLYKLESNVLGQLLSAAGEGGRNTQRHWWEKKAGDLKRIGSDRTDGGDVETGSTVGPTVPSGFLRLSAGEIGAGCSRASAAEMLEVRLGYRS
jgi:hypothetical protein